MSVILTCTVAVISYWVLGLSFVNYIDENEDLSIHDKIGKYKLIQSVVS